MGNVKWSTKQPTTSPSAVPLRIAIYFATPNSRKVDYS